MKLTNLNNNKIKQGPFNQSFIKMIEDKKIVYMAEEINVMRKLTGNQGFNVGIGRQEYVYFSYPLNRVMNAKRKRMRKL